MTTYNISTNFDPKTRVMTATRGKTVVSKKLAGIVIPRDHGIAASSLLSSLGVRLPLTLVLDSTKTEMTCDRNAFKFSVGITKA